MRATNTLTGEPTAERPTMRSPGIYRRAAEILYERIGDYGIDVDDASLEKVLKHLTESVTYGRGGYERAKLLERRGWMPDAEMVEWLDDDTVYDAHREAVREWVQKEGIVPSLSKGDTVSISHPHHADKSPATGTIIGIDDLIANYTVYVPAWGHVDKGNGTHGIILPFETVERVQP